MNKLITALALLVIHGSLYAMERDAIGDQIPKAPAEHRRLVSPAEAFLAAHGKANALLKAKSMNDKEKEDALQRAVEKESLADLRAVLALGVNDNAKEEALKELVEKRNWYLTKVVLHSGMDDDAKEDALLYAVDNELLRFVNLFLECGLSCDLKDLALEHAAQKGYLSIVDVLLAAGVSQRGKDQALVTADAQQIEVIKSLLTAGVSETAKKLAVRCVLISNGFMCPISSVDVPEMRCALLHAAREGNVTGINFLLAAGVSVSAQGEALLCAAEKRYLDALNVLELHWQKGSQAQLTAHSGSEGWVDQRNAPNVAVEKENISGTDTVRQISCQDVKTIEIYKNKAVRKAVQNNDQGIVDALLALGASKQEAIEAAVEADNLSTIARILEKEKELFCQALVHAAEKGSVRVIKELLTFPLFKAAALDEPAGTVVQSLAIAKEYKEKALHKAALARRPAILKLLVEHNVHIPSNTNVLLMLKSFSKHERTRAWSEMVKILLNSGITDTVRDTLLDLCIKNSDLELLKLLLSCTIIPDGFKAWMRTKIPDGFKAWLQRSAWDHRNYGALEELLRSGINVPVAARFLRSAFPAGPDILPYMSQLRLLEAHIGAGIDLRTLGFFAVPRQPSLLNFIAFCQTPEACAYRAKFRRGAMPSLAELYVHPEFVHYMEYMQNPNSIKSPESNPAHPVHSQHAFQVTSSRQTMLTWAVLFEHKESIQALLARPDLQRRFITAPDERLYSPLRYAAAMGNRISTYDLLRAVCFHQFKDKQNNDVAKKNLEPIFIAAQCALKHGHVPLAFLIFNEWILDQKFVIGYP